MSPAATVPDCLKIRLNKSYKLSPRGCEAPTHHPLPGTAASRPPRPTEAASRKQSRKPAGVESPQGRKPSRVGEGKRSVYKGAEGVGDINPQISLEKPKFAQVNLINALHITVMQVK
jgi:hypothetical protein